MNTKRNTKDSIFTNLFSDPVYQLQLYQELNPDSENVTIDDIQDVTLENIFTIQQMNDLGFIVKDKILFLVEAQSTWTENILLRMLFYYFETLKRRITDNDLNVYSSKPIAVLKPVFYIIYTGDQAVPDSISFKDIYFQDEEVDFNCSAHIIHETNNKNTISTQYICFANIFDQQRKKYGYSKKTIEETIRICKNEGILKSYIESRESEVINIMSYFMDQEKVTELTIRDIKEEARIEGQKIGEEIGIQKGEKIGVKKGEEIGRQKGEEIGIQKGEEIGIQKGEKIGIQKGEKIGERNALVSLVRDGLLSKEDCLKRTGLTEEEFYKIYSEMK